MDSSNKRDAIPRGTDASRGIDSTRIASMVDQFYAAVREDPELSPVFAKRIDGDWDPHLDNMRRFWRTVLLAEKAYRGNPMAVHQQIDGLTPALFDRWLRLFDATVNDVFTPEAARIVSGRAHRMARALSAVTLGARCA